MNYEKIEDFPANHDLVLLSSVGDYSVFCHEKLMQTEMSKARTQCDKQAKNVTKSLEQYVRRTGSEESPRH